MEPKDAFHALDRVELVDVREQWEWDAGHIEGARHVPLGELPARLDELPPGRPVVVVCRSGARSADATEFLRAQGFDAHNLDGGVQLWTGEGLPYSGVVV
ncbi:MAG TPA: rhodanese-like domain-containing protein [Actinomycetota bacterium]|nr:rhodanese-like domain-containing protein [Actinomycetota bacterium]